MCSVLSSKVPVWKLLPFFIAIWLQPFKTSEKVDLDLFVHALSVLIPQAQANRARLLAVASPRRAAATPEVPSVTELGFPELTMEGLCGFFGARGMAVATRERIAADVMTVANEPAVRQRLAAIGQTAHRPQPRSLRPF